jgi:hypothetical protein
MRVMLRPAGMSEPWDIIRTSREPPEWRIGHARPIRMVAAVQSERGKPAPMFPTSSMTGVRQIANRTAYPGEGIPTARGERPWWVLVEFWWRRPSTEIPWPGFRVDSIGRRVRTVTDADWVLDWAGWVSPEADTAPRPDDATSLETHAATSLSAGLPVVAIVLLLAVAASYGGGLRRLLR